MRRGRWFPLFSFFAGLSAAASAYDFGVDPGSPEVLTFQYGPSDIIHRDGSGVHISGSALGLGADQLDDFSYGKDLLRPLGANYYVSLQYSVSRGTVGAGGVVTKQVNGNGAAGDKFAMLILRNGRTIGPFLESDAPNHNLTPLPNIQSNIDGLSFPPGTLKGVYYTVGRGGVKQPSDIWYVAEPGITPPVLYATAAQLGLVAGDNIDCLMVKDGGTIGALDSADVVNVSLDTASPTRIGAPSNGSDDILQVFPGAPTVAIPFNKLDITSAPTEEIDACTAYDPGTERGGGSGTNTGLQPAQVELLTAQGFSPVLSGELDAAGLGQIYAGVYTGTIAHEAWYTTVDFGLKVSPAIKLPVDWLKYEPDSDEHVVKGGLLPWDRGTSLIDKTTGDQQFHYFTWLGAGLGDTIVIKRGDPIPGMPGQTMQSFNRCGASSVGTRPCFHATLRNQTFQPFWSAICRDGAGSWTQGATFAFQGMVVNGKTIAGLNLVDCSPDDLNPNVTSCYGTATTNTGERVMLRIDGTPNGASAPIWSMPSIILDATTPAPGGGFFNDYGLQTAAGSVVFHGKATTGGDGIYRLAGGVITKIADKTTPVPGGTGTFTSFGDDLSNDGGATTFLGNSAGGQGIYTNLTGRLQKVVQVNDVIGGRTVNGLSLARDAASMSVVAFGVRFNDGFESIVIKEFPIPFDTTNATQRAIHVDVELDPDPALLGPDPRALLVGDLGTARLRGIWTSDGTTGHIKIPGSEVARLVALQFGATPAGPFPEWVITVDVATGAVLSSKASGTLANGPFAYDGDTNGGPWTSPLVGAIPGTNAGFETDGGGLKRFCSNAFSSLGGGACGAGAFGFPAPATYNRSNGFVHTTGPVTLGNVVLWGFLGDQRWLEQPAGGCPDIDSDGVCDDVDDCVYEPNEGQQDAGGVGTGSLPDGIGDACQCGDQSGNGVVTLQDAVILQRSFLSPPTAVRDESKCDVGSSAGCSLADAVLLRRSQLSPPTATLTQACDAAQP